MREMHLLFALYKSCAPKRHLIWLTIVLYVPVTLLSVVPPLIIGRVANGAMLQEGLGYLLTWAGVFLGAVVLHALVDALQLYVMQDVGQYTVYALRKRLFAHIQNLPISYFDKNPLGLIMTRIIHNVDAVSELFLSGSVQIVGDLLFVFATLIMLLIVNVKLSLASFALLPVLAIGVFYFRKFTRQALLQVSASLAKLNTFLQERLSGISTVQAFNQTSKSKVLFEEDNYALMHSNKRAIFLDASIYAFVDTIAYLTVACVIFVAFNMRLHSALELGVLVAFIEALNRFFQPIKDLSSRFALFQAALVGAERVFDFLEEKVYDAPTFGKEVLHFQSSIRFENVNFAYGPDKQILFDVNFEVKKGQQVALVGATGAGKSSVLKLLSRLYPLHSGRILIDGVDYDAFSKESYRDFITVVSQEVFLFEGTLRDNVCYGVGAQEDAQIVKALEHCQVGYLLERPLALLQPVLRGGGNFSLGERQLLVMARALLADPKLLLLDEATASVDADTERHLQVATKTLLQGRTAFIVAHRLSTIQSCDTILVFHQGHLVEQGNHAALLEHGGVYAKLVALNEAASKCEDV